MKKNQITYVSKTFKILVVSMGFMGEYQYRFHTALAANQHSHFTQTETLIRQIFQLNSIDTVQNNQPQNKDKNVNLQLFMGQVYIGGVIFDISKQKFVQPDSHSLFRKRFTNGRGYIDYKFVGAQTDVITKEQLSQSQMKRNKIYLHKNKDYKVLLKENKDYVSYLAQKDKMIDHLTEKINSLLQQNIGLNKKINEDMKTLHSPMSINVNILSNKIANKETNIEIKQFAKMQSDYEIRMHEYEGMKQRISELQIENKILGENIDLLVNQMKMEGNKQENLTKINKKMSGVDTLYLLNKHITEYDKPLSPSRVFNTIPEEENQHSQTNILQSFAPQFRKQKKETSLQFKISGISNHLKESHNLSSKQLRGSGLFAKQKQEHNNQHIIKVPSLRDIKKFDPKIVINSPSEMTNSLTGAMAKEHIQTLQGVITNKEKQIQILTNELKKKDELINKINKRQKELHRTIMELQQEKSRLLTHDTFKMLGETGKESTEVQSRFKQLSVYNNELMREKRSLMQQLLQYRTENIKSSQRLADHQMINRKSLMVMSQMKQQKNMLEKTLKDLTEGQKMNQMKELAEQGMKYQFLKVQFIECQGELNEKKKRCNELQEQLLVKEKVVAKSKIELTESREQQKKLGLIAARVSRIQRDNQSMNRKYQQVQKLNNNIKIFVLKMEGEVYKKFKIDKDADTIRSEIKTLFREIFQKINKFTQEYNDALVTVCKFNQASLQKYYEEIMKYYEDASGSEGHWSRRAELFKDREVKMEELKEKEELLLKKATRKLMVPDDQRFLAVEGIRRMEQRLKELQKYKVKVMKAIRGEDVKDDAIFQAFPGISVNSPDKSPNESLLQMIEMIKSNPNFLNSLPKEGQNFIKSSGIMKISANMMRSEMLGARSKISQKDEDLDISGIHNSNSNSSLAAKKTAENQDTMKMLSQKFSQYKQGRESYISDRQRELKNASQLRQKESVLMKEKIALQSELAKQKLSKKSVETIKIKQAVQKAKDLEGKIIKEQIQKERVITQYKNRQAELQREAQKAKKEFEQNLVVQRKLQQKLSNDLQEMGKEVDEKEKQIVQFTVELQQLSREYQVLIVERNQLKMRVEQLQSFIEDYERAERRMRSQVLQIKERHKNNQEEMNMLMEERNRQFMDIQKIKSQEIGKLKKMVFQLEVKLSDQISQNFNRQAKIQQYLNQNKQMQQKMLQNRQQAQIVIQNTQIELNKESILRQALQRQNQTYNKNIVQLSGYVQERQKEIMRLGIIVENHLKEKQILKQMQITLDERQINYKQEYMKFDYIILDKNNRIADLEKNYHKIQQEISIIERDTRNVKEQNIKLQQQLDLVRDKEFARERQIIQLQRQISCKQIKLSKSQGENQQSQKALQQLTIKYQHLQQHMEEPPSARRKSQSGIKSNTLDIDPYMSYHHKKQMTSMGNQFTSIRKSRLSNQVRKMNSLPPSSDPESQSQRGSQENDIMSINHQHLRKGSTNEITTTKQTTRKTDLLEVRVIPRNKILNLASVDSQIRGSDQNAHLGVIKQHYNQMEDTFFRDNRHKLSDDMAQFKMEYQGEDFTQEHKMQQSAIDIDIFQSTIEPTPKKSVQFIGVSQMSKKIEGSERREIEGTSRGAFKDYQSYQTLDLVGKIIELQAQNDNLKRQFQRMEDENLQKQPDISGLKASQDVQTPYINIHTVEDMRNASWNNWGVMADEPQSPGKKSNRSIKSKSPIRSSSAQNISQTSVKMKRLQTEKSVYAMQLMMKDTEQEVKDLRGRCEQAERRVNECQLIMQENKGQIGELLKSVKEKKRNIDILMQQVKIVSETNCELSLRSQKLKKVVVQLNETIQELKFSNTTRCEQLIKQSLQKDETIYNCQLQLRKQIQMNQKLKNYINQQEGKIQDNKKKYKAADKKLSQYKKQYIQYEEQAQYDILKLKEENDKLREDSQQRERDIIQIGQKYLEVQDGRNLLVHGLNQQKQSQMHKTRQINSTLINLQNVKGEVQRAQQQRKQMLAKIQSYERQNIKLREQLQDLSSKAAMETQKHQIQLRENNNWMDHLKFKLQQKQKVVIELKNQIGLYNNQTQTLRLSNQELNGQLIRAQKSLKEIMVAYQQQFLEIKHMKEREKKENVEYLGSLKQKQMQIQFSNQNIRNYRHQIKILKEQNAQINSQLHKYKLTVTVRVRDLENQIAIKNDRIERLNSEVQILSSKLSEDGEGQLDNKKVQKQLKGMIVDLRDQLDKKQLQIQTKQKELQQRPTKEKYNNLKFKVELMQNSLKNSKTDRTVLSKQKQKQQQESNNLINQYESQLSKVKQIWTKDRQKYNRAIDQLKQLVEAYKKLQSERNSLNKQHQTLRRSSNSQQVHLRHQQTYIQELKRQNEELHRLSREASKRSFSRITTDITL